LPNLHLRGCKLCATAAATFLAYVLHLMPRFAAARAAPHWKKRGES
jgi:hypothetical protein